VMASQGFCFAIQTLANLKSLLAIACDGLASHRGKMALPVG